ncbi:tissue-type plasminogen activator [Protopterus annectens]|uniref:tissue-type plasminogen activator n=1 Tax=Protopterus annectens TaxID=7888 RepID=UPI001CF96F46|nr:tissue-type plasminogen activator [Protopterus annectens]
MKFLCFLAIVTIASASSMEDIHIRTRRGARSSRGCQDPTTIERYQKGETWLRTAGRRVEYCRCEKNEELLCHSVPVFICINRRCYNGGQCKEAVYSDHFVCQCPNGFKGKLCEIDATSKCYEGRGTSYRGTWSMTSSGLECLNWDNNILRDSRYNAHRHLSMELGLGTHNFCRNPDNDTKPWCHVLKGSQRSWEFCSVPQCPKSAVPDCYTGNGSGYRGTWSTSESGTNCINWNSQILRNKPSTAWSRDSRQLGLGSHNYCRNPDKDRKPWCYVFKGSSLTQEHCNIPKCGTCGQRQPKLHQFRIKGGRNIDISMHPWQAAIYVSRMRGQAFLCGGTLINPCWVISAAHCFEKGLRPDQLKVVLGRTYRVQPSDEEQKFEVEEYFSHEAFNSITFDNDIVLLKIKSSTGKCAQEASSIRTVCLPEKGLQLPDWTDCEVSGYGKEKETSIYYSEKLKEARVKLVPYTHCKVGGDQYGPAVTKNMICAADIEGQEDACKGDSGGPLVCSHDGRMHLIGVVSWGEGCGEKDKPGVYTKVAEYHDWMYNIMNSN